MNCKSGSLVLVVVWTFSAITLITSGSCDAQSKAGQTAGVDNTAMGPYRALAQLTFEAFTNGNNAKAAELARILERTWDAAEEAGGSRSLGVRNKDVFDEVDTAMDNFIKPIMHYSTKPPDAAAVRSAYANFLEELKKGD